MKLPNYPPYCKTVHRHNIPPRQTDASGQEMGHCVSGSNRSP